MPYDVAFFWSSATDQIINKYQIQLANIWGGLTRLGLRLRFMNDKELRAGEHKKVKLIVLPRNERMHKGDLQYFKDVVIPDGVHVYADADLPGYADYHIQSDPNFNQLIQSIFGVKPIKVNAFETNITEYYFKDERRMLQVTPQKDFGPVIADGRVNYFTGWKYHHVESVDATVLATFQYNEIKPITVHPAVTIKSNGESKGKGLLSTFVLGDTKCEYRCFTRTWREHYDWYKGMIMSQVGLNIRGELTHEGSQLMQISHQYLKDGRILIYVSNWNEWGAEWGKSGTETVVIRLASMNGRTVHDLFSRKLITESSDGSLQITMNSSETTVLIVGEPIKPAIYISTIGTQFDLVPSQKEVTVHVDFTTAGNTLDVIVELQRGDKVYASVTKKKQTGNVDLTVPLMLDPNLFDVSTFEGAGYFYYAALVDNKGKLVASTKLDCVSVSLGLRLYDQAPLALDKESTIRVKWEHPAIQRVKAFPGIVALFNSSLTAKRDPDTVDRMWRIAYLLKTIGYVERNIHDVFDCILVMKGPQFVVINDLADLAPLKYTDIPIYRTLILPGVSVLSDDEVKHIKSFMTTIKHSVVISTDSVAGRYNGVDDSDQSARLADLFGVKSSGKQSVGGDVVITNTDHPITRLMKPNQVIKTAGVLRQEYNEATASTSLGKRGNTPSIFVYKRKIALDYPVYSLVLNFDPSQPGSDDDYKQMTLLFKGIAQWMSEADQLLKIRWELQCDKDIVASASAWVDSIQGETELKVKPNSNCVNKQPKWVGYTYPWDSPQGWNDRVSLYNSYSMSFPGSGNEKLTTAPTAAPGLSPAVSKAPTATNPPEATKGGDNILNNLSSSLIPSLSSVTCLLLFAFSVFILW
ncbi:hypothetical protein AKO1_010850 [Acrasis kona]|uniref:Uncharacterized protein n=1 Tax=Acrasis kona TaxID=1008807 RepID=A0AAW2YK86_9EUKA